MPPARLGVDPARGLRQRRGSQGGPEADPLRPHERREHEGPAAASGRSGRRSGARAGGQRRRLLPDRAGAGWGLVYDTSVDRLWIANPYFPDFGINGDGLEHQYLPDGTETGETIDIHETGGIWQADGTLQRADRNALAGQRRRRQLPLRDGSRHEGRDRPEDLRALGGLAARRGLRLRDRHLLRRRNQRRHGLPPRRIRQPPRLRVRRPSRIAGLAYNPTTRHLFLASTGPGAPGRLGRSMPAKATRSSAASA